ncbi:MAG TPA: transposase [Edaphobacter sp.]|nr:transposase [Edaphobacter sp.]
MRQTGQSYFVSSQTADRKPFFRHERWAQLFLNVLENYRTGYLLHAYMLMPDHIHLLLTPTGSLEKAVQQIKGGFSYKVKKELNWQGEVWQKGFSDHRIRDIQDWNTHLEYIRMNPVHAKLCIEPEEYLYGSQAGSLEMDAVPQRLKPLLSCDDNGGAEAPPLQRPIERR